MRYHILIYTQMLSNYCCAQMSNFKRLRLLGHTLRQGYDVRPVYTLCTKQFKAYKRMPTARSTLKRNAVLDVVRCILDFLNLILRTLFLQMRRIMISHWKYLLTGKIVAFTVRAMKESLRLRQKDFRPIMRLVVFLKMVSIKRQTLTEVNRTVETAFKGRYQRRRRTN